MVNEHMKRYLSLIISINKTTRNYHFTHIMIPIIKKKKKTSAGEDVEKLEAIGIAGRNMK